MESTLKAVVLGAGGFTGKAVTLALLKAGI